MSHRPPARPERDEVKPEDHEAYDYVLGRLGNLTEEYRTTGPGAYHGALLNAPQVAAGLNRLGAITRTGSLRGSYTDAERELCDVVLSKDFGYNGVLPIHLPDMFAVGVRPDAIDAIREGRDGDLEPDERQLVDYVRAVANGRVTDEEFDAAGTALGPERRRGLHRVRVLSRLHDADVVGDGRREPLRRRDRRAHRRPARRRPRDPRPRRASRLTERTRRRPGR